MPTTIEVVHYEFKSDRVYCGYKIDRCPRVSKHIGKVTCLKCLKLLNGPNHLMPKRLGKGNPRKLHLFFRETEFKEKYLTQCGRELPQATLFMPADIKVCRTCERNKRARSPHVDS